MKTDWKKVLLGDYCEIILGGTPNTKDPSYWGGNIPWASVADFNVNKVIYTTQKTITEKGLNESNTKLLKVGDIIISARGTVGKTVVCGVPMAFNQSCYALRSTSKELLQDFLYYLINYHVNQLKKKATGGVFDTIVTDTLKNFEIKIPNFYIQQKIAAILSAYDDLIENNLRRIKILEEMARTIYREWFVKFRFPGHEKVRMVDSPLGKIPEGWEVSTVGDNITVVSRKNKIKTSDYLTEGVIPVIDQGKDFIAGFVDDTSLAYDGPLPIIVFGDHTCVLKWVDFRFAVGADGTQLILPSHPEKLPPIFLFYTLQFLPIKQFGYQRHFKYLKEAKILLPPNSLTQKFNEVVNTQKNLILNLRLKNLNLRRTRDLLLPKLISGEIDVSELDIKIPDTERS